MKLTLKLTLIATSVMALVLTALAGWTIRLEAELLEADIERDAALIALSLARSGVGSRALQAVDRGLTARAPGELKVSMTRAGEEGLTGDEGGLREGRVLLRRERRYEEEWVVAYASHDTAGGAEAQLVRVAESLRPRDALQARLAWLNALAVLLTTLIGSGATLLLGRRLVGRRIEALVEQSRRLGEGEYSHLNAVGGADELEELGRALNQLSADLERSERATEREARARLEAERTLMHVDRLRVVGELAAGIAHEVGTPLAVVMGRAQLIARRGAQAEEVAREAQGDRERSARDAEVIRAQSQRISDLVRQLLNYARVSEPRRERCDLGALLEQTRSLLSPIARKGGVELTPCSSPPAYALVDPVLFGQAMTNVVMNAIQALSDPRLAGRRRAVWFKVSPEGSVGGSVGGVEGEGYWAISVRDSGLGFTHPDRALGIFWTTKPPGEGSGLGLTIVERILTEHGGEVEVGNHPEGGAEVVLRWPACAPLSAPPPHTHERAQSAEDTL